MEGRNDSILCRAIIAPPWLREQKYLTDIIFSNVTGDEPLFLLASVIIKLSEMRERWGWAVRSGQSCGPPHLSELRWSESYQTGPVGCVSPSSAVYSHSTDKPYSHFFRDERDLFTWVVWLCYRELLSGSSCYQCHLQSSSWQECHHYFL